MCARVSVCMCVVRWTVCVVPAAAGVNQKSFLFDLHSPLSLWQIGKGEARSSASPDFIFNLVSCFMSQIFLPLEILFTKKINLRLIPSGQDCVRLYIYRLSSTHWFTLLFLSTDNIWAGWRARYSTVWLLLYKNVRNYLICLIVSSF